MSESTLTAAAPETLVGSVLHWHPGHCIGERVEFDFSSDRVPDKGVVAALSREQIEHMEPTALARVIRAASMPLSRSHSENRLKMLDGDTLRRLAYLARRTCRNQGY